MKRGRKCVVDRKEVVEYALANPSATHKDIAVVFSVTAWTIGAALRSQEIKGTRRGRPVKRKTGMTDEEYEWEQRLHAHGLGMCRGLRLGGNRLYYGYDPARQEIEDESVTRNSNF